MYKIKYLTHVCASTILSRTRTISVVLLVILLGACSKDSTPVGPDSLSYSPPKAGSTFRYDSYSTDTTNSLPIASSHDTSIHTVLQNGLSYAGKTNVTMISTVTRFSTDTSYLNYETNGDVSSYGPTKNGEKGWGIIPIGSKTTFTLVMSDTTFIVSGVSFRNKLTTEVSYVGTENLTVNGKTLSVIKLKEALIIAATTAGVTSSKTLEVFIWFAPSLGYVVKSDQPVQDSPFGGGKQEGSVEMLLDYTLK